ncbi:amino acid adenylation domain-containing protein [Streptomyces pseudovenezuelae]|uniref:D-alanine--poly(Phosphoribitol) ligase subunit 1 n=1 Tax=Streptomyces pseudovenezuelae TaxID=67350 RepID=A0ABT6M0Q2_9ACTN|nr:amino acid adenylation domain-containing protein [Streptomyces pseudovenezuelae]MDH6222144.1 D-alanine--poly(phosphoribitol) ligase subunit 1 [Streptomyces pseudovenezuelae]
MQEHPVAFPDELTGRTVEYHCPAGLPGLIRAVTVRTPDAIAVVDDTQELTYLELELWSDAVARRLREHDVSSDPVAVAVPRSAGLLAALLGVLKAGLPYLPVDAADPADRLRRVLSTAGTSIALTSTATHQTMAAQELHALDVETLRPTAPIAGPESLRPTTPVSLLDALLPVAAVQPVYVLFTSGSTGTPKGVLLPSQALCNRLLWMRDEYGIGPTDRILQKTPVTFDVSGWELWMPLVSGARCVFLAPEEHREPVQVARTVVAAGITICHFVPSMLNEFLRWSDAAHCTSLRDVFCSGEALPAAVARRFAATLPARLHNLYGPTEAAIEVTYWDCPRDPDAIDRVFIGRPVHNCVLGVMNPDGAPVPAGEEGELYIGGVPLATGYLNRPDLTAQAFVPAAPSDPVPTWYRTGDRVRLVHGELEYLGRIDDQVKIRGQRIEPHEVEHHLTTPPQVAEAVVVAARIGEDVQLVAWIRPTDPRADAQQLRAQLREHLSGQVPAAYVPSRFLLTDTVPMTTSGKQDRTLLRQRAEEQVAVRTPRTGSSAAAGGRRLLDLLRRERDASVSPRAAANAAGSEMRNRRHPDRPVTGSGNEIAPELVPARRGGATAREEVAEHVPAHAGREPETPASRSTDSEMLSYGGLHDAAPALSAEPDSHPPAGPPAALLDAEGRSGATTTAVTVREQHTEETA